MLDETQRQGARDRPHDRTAEAPENTLVSLYELPHRAMVTLRGDAGDHAFREAVELTVGAVPPAEPMTAMSAGVRQILWMGPDEWLVTAPVEERATLPVRLVDALAGVHSAVTETGESMIVLGLAGPRARDVLCKGCALDLHPRAFPAGRVVRTLLAKAGVVLHQTDETPVYEIYVHRSFSAYLWHWLKDAGLEYGEAMTVLRS